MIMGIRLREIKNALERAFRGFGELDVLNISFWFKETMDKMIRWRLKNIRYYPDGMTEYEWENTLIDMLEHLRMMDDDAAYKELFGDKDTCLLTMDDWLRVQHLVDFHKEEFMKLFNKYFWEL